MFLATSSNPVSRPGAEALPPPAILDSLAAHARTAGAALFLLSPEGAVLYHDPAAPAFFHRYVAAAMRHAPYAAELRACMATLDAEEPSRIWEPIPGVILCARPYVQRRQVRAAVALAARSEGFDAAALASAAAATGGDGAWAREPGALPPSRTASALFAAAGMIAAMLADRMRLAAVEHELHSLSTQLSNSYEELSLIERVTGGMRVNRHSRDFFREICLEVMQVVNVRAMGVALPDEDASLYGEISLADEDLDRLAEQLLADLRQRKDCLLVNAVAADPEYRWLAPRASRMLALPLQRGSNVLGCLFAIDKASGDFDSVDAKLLNAIASNSAIYLENAMLYGDVHDLMMGLLHALTSAVDAKDAYTCGHSERVALLARRLALSLGLNDDAVEQVYIGGLLHDVGKIGIAESVLQKAGKLTEEEFEQIKRHPGIGARILADVKQLEQVVPGVLHHHERYDGRGYPAGLAADEIPLIGRIIALADCFDAMTTSRSYRKALPLETALEEIRRCRGSQFDPALADCFLAIGKEPLEHLLRQHEQGTRKLLELQEKLRAA